MQFFTWISKHLDQFHQGHIHRIWRFFHTKKYKKQKLVLMCTTNIFDKYQ